MAEKLTKEEAEKLIESWADFMELDTDRMLYENLVEELRNPVKLGKLAFEEETETFRLVLRYPVEVGGSKVNMVEIKSCDLGSKRVLQRIKEKDTIDQARAMIAAYTSQPESAVKQMKDIDINRINAVIMGFITQVDPKKD